jgi:acyl carrier protein
VSTITLDDVVRKIAELSGGSGGPADADAITLDTRLDSLVSDSFALVEMAIALQEDFDVIFTQDDLRDATTVGQIFDLIRRASSGASALTDLTNSSDRRSGDD